MKVVLAARLAYVQAEILRLGYETASVPTFALSNSPVIREMRELRAGPVPVFGFVPLVSDNYDETCLAVDVWFLRKKARDEKRRNGMILGDETGLSLGWPEKLALRTVILALVDVCEGRPCDAGKWSPDPPPTLQTCTSFQHICADDGERYIHEVIRQGWEPFLGLDFGKLSRMLEILDCEGRSES